MEKNDNKKIKQLTAVASETKKLIELLKDKNEDGENILSSLSSEIGSTVKSLQSKISEIQTSEKETEEKSKAREEALDKDAEELLNRWKAK